MGEFLEVQFAVRQGGLALEVRFALKAPWTSLFGASGSGKSTMLRVIAGLVRPDGGRVVLRRVGGEEQVLFDSARGLCVRTDRRWVRMAGQQPWLFPGSVRENVGYGVATPEARRLDEVSEVFRLRRLMGTDVRTLSGGERQRVSLARAVAATLYGRERAGLLLLDEPFAGMDAALRDELAVQLRGWLADERVPVLSVTHDVGEAFLLGAEVIRVAEGRVLAQGPVGEVLAEERLRLRAVLGEEGHPR